MTDDPRRDAPEDIPDEELAADGDDIVDPVTDVEQPPPEYDDES